MPKTKKPNTEWALEELPERQEASDIDQRMAGASDKGTVRTGDN